MIQRIKDFVAKKQQQRKTKRYLDLCYKYWQIARATLQYYTDNSTGLDIDPVVRANQELKEKIKTESDLIYWHKKLKLSGLGFHYQRRQKCY